MGKKFADVLQQSVSISHTVEEWAFFGSVCEARILKYESITLHISLPSDELQKTLLSLRDSLMEVV